MAMSLNIHNVVSAELANTFLENNNQRTIRITDDRGERFEFILYGETDALECLPRSDNFIRYTYADLTVNELAVAS
ncbi:MAG TPA: hypothetical protein VHP34_11320 [Alphaproteobacteria bacterium]|nr:hypothetical protein [Alphaproteobacteria bacterium]